MAQFDLAYNSALAQGSRLLWSNPASGTVTTYTEIGRWNDTSADYRTANEADYTNFGTASICFNRNPLNNVADPFPLNTSKTYRLRYVQGGSATQASAQVIGTPTQAHIDTSPGGGIACYRFGTIANMTAAFGNPVSNPNSPVRFNGGQWILEEQTITTNTPDNLPRLCREPFTTTQNTYNEVARWNVSGGSSNFQSRNADYYTQGTSTGILDGALYANNYSVNSGSSPYNASLLVNDGNQYRLRLVGHTGGGTNALPAGKPGTITGNVSFVNSNPFGNFNRQAIIITSASAMRAAFGDPTIGISAGGGFWVLERVASTTVTGKRLAWKTRTALTSNDVVYARDDVANNLIWRTPA